MPRARDGGMGSSAKLSAPRRSAVCAFARAGGVGSVAAGCVEAERDAAIAELWC